MTAQLVINFLLSFAGGALAVCVMHMTKILQLHLARIIELERKVMWLEFNRREKQ